MPNELTDHFRSVNPGVQMSDEDITLSYLQKYGVDGLAKFPRARADALGIMQQLFPPSAWDYAKQAYGSAARGAIGGFAFIPESVASLAHTIGAATVPGGLATKDTPLVPGVSDLGLRSLANAVTPDPIPSLQDSFWATKAPQGLGSTAAFAAGGAIGNALKLPGLAVTAGMGALAGAQQGREDALASGATVGQSFKSSLANAAIGTSEALPLAGIIERINFGTRGGFAAIMKAAVAEIGEESAQEAFQQTMQNAIASNLIGYDPQRGWSEGVASNAAVGGVSGAIMSLFASAVGMRLHHKNIDVPAPTTVAPAPEPPPNMLTPAPAGAPAIPGAPAPAPVTGMPAGPGVNVASTLYRDLMQSKDMLQGLATRTIADENTPEDQYALSAIGLDSNTPLRARWEQALEAARKAAAGLPQVAAPTAGPGIATPASPLNPATGGPANAQVQTQAQKGQVTPPPNVVAPNLAGAPGNTQGAAAVSSVAAPSPAPPPSPSPAAAPAGVPAFVSKALTQQLYDLGYSKSDVDTMAPQDAVNIVGGLITKSKPGVKATVTAAQKKAASAAVAALTGSADASTQRIIEAAKAQVATANKQSVEPKPVIAPESSAAKQGEWLFRRGESGQIRNPYRQGTPQYAAYVAKYLRSGNVAGEGAQPVDAGGLMDSVNFEHAAQGDVRAGQSPRVPGIVVNPTEEQAGYGTNADAKDRYLTRKLVAMLSPDKQSVVLGSALKHSTRGSRDVYVFGHWGSGHTAQKGFKRLVNMGFTPLAALNLKAPVRNAYTVLSRQQWDGYQQQLVARQQESNSQISDIEPLDAVQYEELRKHKGVSVITAHTLAHPDTRQDWIPLRAISLDDAFAIVKAVDTNNNVLSGPALRTKIADALHRDKSLLDRLVAGMLQWVSGPSKKDQARALVELVNRIGTVYENQNRSQSTTVGASGAGRLIAHELGSILALHPQSRGRRVGGDLATPNQDRPGHAQGDSAGLRSQGTLSLNEPIRDSDDTESAAEEDDWLARGDWKNYKDGIPYVHTSDAVKPDVAGMVDIKYVAAQTGEQGAYVTATPGIVTNPTEAQIFHGGVKEGNVSGNTTKLVALLTPDKTHVVVGAASVNNGNRVYGPWGKYDGRRLARAYSILMDAGYTPLAALKTAQPVKEFATTMTVSEWRAIQRQLEDAQGNEKKYAGSAKPIGELGVVDETGQLAEVPGVNIVGNAGLIYGYQQDWVPLPVMVLDQAIAIARMIPRADLFDPSGNLLPNDQLRRRIATVLAQQSSGQLMQDVIDGMLQQVDKPTNDDDVFALHTFALGEAVKKIASIYEANSHKPSTADLDESGFTGGLAHDLLGIFAISKLAARRFLGQDTPGLNTEESGLDEGSPGLPGITDPEKLSHDANDEYEDPAWNDRSGKGDAPSDARIERLFNLALNAARDGGILVEIADGVASEFGAYSTIMRAIRLGLIDADHPTHESLVNVFHEIAHHVSATLPADVRAAVHQAVSNMSLEDLGIADTTYQEMRDGTIDPSKVVEEKLAEHLARVGIDQGQSTSLASQIMRLVKELFYRFAMAMQKLWGREPSGNLALAFAENRLASWVNGNPITANLTEYLVPPLPRAVQAESFTRAEPVGWLAERMNHETGAVELGRTLDGPIEWDLHRGPSEQPGVPSNRNTVVINARVALANHEIDIQHNALSGVGGLPKVAAALAQQPKQTWADWVAKKLRLPNAVAIRERALRTIDPETKVVIPGNPDQRIHSFKDQSNITRTSRDALQMTRTIMGRVATASSDATTWIKAHTQEIQDETAKLIEYDTLYTNVDAIANDVTKSLRKLVRGIGDIADTNKTNSPYIRQLRALVGPGELRTNRAVYLKAMAETFKRSTFFADTFTLLDEMVRDNIDFDGSIGDILAQVVAINRQAYDAVTPDTPAAKAQFALAIAFAKNQPMGLISLELRRVKDTGVRAQILQQLRDALYKSRSIDASLRTVQKASRLQERAVRAFNRQFDLVRGLKAEMDEAEAVVEAAAHVTQYYQQAENELIKTLQWREPVSFGHGMEYLVPVKQANGTYQFVTKTLNIRRGTDITERQTVVDHLDAMKEWLAYQESIEQNGRWLSVRDQYNELLRGIVDPGAVDTRYRQMGLNLSGLTDQAIAMGTPGARVVAQLLNTFTGNQRAFLFAVNKYGQAVERARNAALRLLPRAAQNDASYSVYFFEPIWHYLEKRRDILELHPNDKQAQLNAAFRDFSHDVLSEKSIGGKLLGAKRDSFLKALRHHIDQEIAAGDWLVANNVDQVIDPRIGGIRRRFGVGVATAPLQPSAAFRTLWAAMHPDNTVPGKAWSDIIGNRETKVDSAWAEVGELYDGQGGAAAAEALLAPYFAHPTIQQLFLRQLCNLMPEAAFEGTLGADGVTRLALNPRDVATAYESSGGNVVKMVEALYAIQGPNAKESAGQYLQFIVDTLRRRYSEMRDVFSNVDADGVGKTESIKGLLPGLMVHARTIEHWPAAWREHMSMNTHTMRRATDMLAGQLAFGVENEALEKAYAAMKADADADVDKLATAEHEATTFIGGAMGGNFDKVLIANPKIGTAAELHRLRTVRNNYQYASGFLTKLNRIFHNESKLPADMRLAMVGMRFLVNRILQQGLSALSNLGDTTSFFREYGVNTTTLKATAQLPLSLARLGINSLSQAIAGQVLVSDGSGFRSRMIAMKFTDPLKWQDLRTVVAERSQPGDPYTKRAALAIGKVDKIINFGVNNLFGLGSKENATAPIARPLAPFTWSAVAIPEAIAESLGMRVESFVRRAMKVADHVPNGGLNVTDWAKALEMNSEDRAGFIKMFETALNRYNLDFRGLVSEAIERHPTGQYLLSDESVRKIVSMANNELSMEPNISTATPFTYISTAWQIFSPLLNWTVRQSQHVARMQMGSKGEGVRWLGKRENLADWLLTGRALTALGFMMAGGLGVGYLVDWFSENVLGKKRNLRQLSADNPAGENVMALIEQTSRIGTFGALGELINTASNVGTGEGDNRGISMDRRIVAMSMFMTVQRALSALINQRQVEYTSVVRPLLSATVGNGMLQYLQMFNHVTGAENFESRATARTNVGNWLRTAGRVVGVEIRAQDGGYSTPTQMTPWITKMALAAYGNDASLFAAAYAGALATARELHKPEPEKYVGQAYGGRHPLRNVFRTPPDEYEFNRLMGAMSEDGRKDVSQAISLFNAFGERIGVAPYTGRKAEATGKVSDAATLRSKVFKEFLASGKLKVAGLAF